jgi:hypothetical protein
VEAKWNLFGTAPEYRHHRLDSLRPSALYDVHYRVLAQPKVAVDQVGRTTLFEYTVAAALPRSERCPRRVLRDWRSHPAQPVRFYNHRASRTEAALVLGVKPPTVTAVSARLVIRTGPANGKATQAHSHGLGTDSRLETRPDIEPRQQETS